MFWLILGIVLYLVIAVAVYKTFSDFYELDETAWDRPLAVLIAIFWPITMWFVDF